MSEYKQLVNNKDSEAEDLTTISYLRLDDSKQQVHMKSEIQTEMFVTNMLTLLLLAIVYDTSFFKPVYLGTSLTHSELNFVYREKKIVRTIFRMDNFKHNILYHQKKI